MRMIANSFVTASVVVLAGLAAMPARAADVDVTSTVDAVTVYPDGASVTRAVTVAWAPAARPDTCCVVTRRSVAGSIVLLADMRWSVLCQRT